MTLIRRWVDTTTGASFGNAAWVVGRVEIDTNDNAAKVTMSVYVSQAQYSLGKQPIDRIERDVTGSAYFTNFGTPIVGMAQTYAAGLPEFSGSAIT